MPNIHSPSQHVQVKAGFILDVTAATVNGSGVDVRLFTRAQAVFYSAPSGSGTTSNCKVQESADNATFADVTGAAFAQVTTAGGTQVQVMDIDVTKRLRYLRLVHTGAGGSAAGQAAGTFNLYNPTAYPPAQDNTVVAV